MTTYPIAETFHSLQGEGCWTGTPMFFIRLAGCNVGKYKAGSDRYAMCCTEEGTQFLCDTDYRKTFDRSVEELLREADSKQHICLTGGEPLLHDLKPLFDAFEGKARLHIETSGTITIPGWMVIHSVWLTCSPKQGFKAMPYLMREWKFVVGPTTNISAIESFCHAHVTSDQPVFLQPLNGIHAPTGRNVKHVVDELLDSHPGWRLSAQLHKYLELR